MKKITRFRAYQLGEKGSSFSYSVDNSFTLIEARLNSVNAPKICEEMRITGVDHITNLHITSWDSDHCSDTELELILRFLKPSKIQYPGYEPDSICGRNSKKLIQEYCFSSGFIEEKMTPNYIDSLDCAKERSFSNVIYNPFVIHTKHNDNSIVSLFRTGRFTILSLGDCEDPEIAKRIQNCSIATKETDVLILAHHGADNGFTTDDFIRSINPRIAICSSNYDNQYEHPRQIVRDILYQNGVKLFTTKTGDVLVSCGEDNKVNVVNLISDSKKVSSVYEFRPRLIVGNNGW